MPRNIDYTFLDKMEGYRTEGYIPRVQNKLSLNSGVTIGAGVDLAHQDIDSLQIPSSLKAKILPYKGLKGLEAQGALANQPLHLSIDEVNILDQAVEKHLTEAIALCYNRHSSISFDDLEPEQQTVIVSVGYQYGPALDKATPKFFGFVTSQDWEGAINELRNFNDAFSYRRHQEANLLSQSIT